MDYISLYTRLLKNNKNYNLIFINFKYNIYLSLNIKYDEIFKKNQILYLKLIKCYFIENGFKILLFENWYKFGIKYNLILKLLI